MFSHAIRHLSDTAPGALPYDAEVEYIENTGLEYIDLDIVPSSNLIIRAEFDSPKSAGTWVIGSVPHNDSSDLRIFRRADNAGGAEFYHDRRANRIYGAKTSFTGGSQNHFCIEAGNHYVKDLTNNTTVLSGTAVSDYTWPDTTKMRIFDLNVNAISKIYWCQFVLDGVMLVDLVPVRVGPEYCLYDKANPTGGDNGDGLYHNKGTGAFLGGVDKPKFVVSRVMGNSLGKVKPILKHYDMAMSYTIDECNGNAPSAVNVNFPSDKYSALNYTPTWAHHRFVEWSTGGEYDAEVEYLESTGTQYIKTGITQADDLIIECTFQKTGSTVTWGTYFGCGYSDNSAYNILGRHYSTTPTDFNPWFANSTYGQCRVPVSTSSMNTVVVKAGSCVKDGTSYTISTVTGRLSSYEIYLFGANQNNSLWRAQPCRIKRFTIKRGTTVLIDYIPVRVGATGYMYDKVSHQLFATEAGSFTVGNDVSTPQSVTYSDSVIYGVPTIYAKWQLPTTITFDATTGGGQMPGGWTAPDYYDGQPFGTLPTPTHATLNFVGWYDGNGNEVTTSTIITTTNKTLTAQYLAQSYTVDISNGDWELEDPNTNPDTTAYDGVYRNLRYWNSPPGTYVDKLYIDVIGYTSFTVYIRSHAEVNYSYTVAVKADYDPTSFTDAINNKQGATTANNSSTGISAYTAVTYTLDGGSHRICIAYGHKDSIKQNSDRGYLLIPKQQ